MKQLTASIVRKFITVLIAVAAAASAEVTGPIPKGKPANLFEYSNVIRERFAGEQPEPGTAVHVVSPGERIYTRFEVEVIPVALPTEDVTVTKDGIVVEADTEMFAIFTGGQRYYCPQQLVLETRVRIKALCFADRDEDGQIETSTLLGAKLATFKKLKTLRIPYRLSSVEVPRPKKPGFRNELLFQGAAGGVLRLLYREFYDDMIRPAFVQELTYDLNEEMPFEIRFRSLKIEIVSAGNEGLGYRLISGLDK